MSQADRQALALRDLAVMVAKAKGVLISMAGRKCSTCTGTASWN